MPIALFAFAEQLQLQSNCLSARKLGSSVAKRRAAHQVLQLLICGHAFDVEHVRQSGCKVGPRDSEHAALDARHLPFQVSFGADHLLQPWASEVVHAFAPLVLPPCGGLQETSAVRVGCPHTSLPQT